MSFLNLFPNDILFDKNRRFLLITGPNMGGKSTYLRCAALATIMAQAGCYVAAKKAKIGIVDRIFTRVGASDDIKRNHYSCMTYMTQVVDGHPADIHADFARFNRCEWLLRF